MIELPEGITLARQLEKEMTGKIVKDVFPPSSPHKFAWFHGDVNTYSERLCGKKVIGAEAFGIFVEMRFEDDYLLDFNDGVNVRFLKPEEKRPAKYQLMIAFTDDSALVFNVAMYGGLSVHQGEFDNQYYQLSRASLSPLEDGFDYEYFQQLISAVKPTMSAKAFLATEQRIPGLGNGALQDILLTCRIHPKRKLGSLSAEQQQLMFQAVKQVLAAITDADGRDTEKDIYGNAGGYRTLLSKNTYKLGCPICGGAIEKQAYLGGSVYTCPNCQPI